MKIPEILEEEFKSEIFDIFTTMSDPPSEFHYSILQFYSFYYKLFLKNVKIILKESNFF